MNPATVTRYPATRPQSWARWITALPAALAALIVLAVIAAQSTGSISNGLALAVSAQALGLGLSGMAMALHAAPRLGFWERRQAPLRAVHAELQALQRLALALLGASLTTMALAALTASWPGALGVVGMAKAGATGVAWQTLALAAGLATGWALHGRAPRALLLALPLLCLAVASASWTWHATLRLPLPVVVFTATCTAYWTWLWLGDRQSLSARGSALIGAEWRAVWSLAWDRVRPSWRRVPFEDETAFGTPDVYALVITPQTPVRNAGPGLVMVILLTQLPQLLGKSGLLIWQQPVVAHSAFTFGMWMVMAGLLATLGLAADDLHWRRTLAPGAQSSRQFGVRMLWQSGRLALLWLALIGLVGVAIQPWAPEAAGLLWEGLPMLAGDLVLAFAMAAWARGWRNTRIFAFLGAFTLGGLAWIVVTLAAQYGWPLVRGWQVLVLELALAIPLAWHATRLWRRHDLATLGAIQRAQA